MLSDCGFCSDRRVYALKMVYFTPSLSRPERVCSAFRVNKRQKNVEQILNPSGKRLEMISSFLKFAMFRFGNTQALSLKVIIYLLNRRWFSLFFVSYWLWKQNKLFFYFLKMMLWDSRDTQKTNKLRLDLWRQNLSSLRQIYVKAIRYNIRCRL